MRSEADETRGAMTRARITDVAKRAGVSIKTVSRVVNEESGVREDTRARVAQAVRELGYVPNSFARSLKSGGSTAIGVIIDAISDPFFASLVGRVEELATEQRLSVLFASTGVSIEYPDRPVDIEHAREQLRRMRGNHVAGLLIAPVPGLTDADLTQLGCPVVCIDRGRDGYDSVVVDDLGASRDAVAAFIAHGHRRIGFVGLDTRFATNMDRLAGFRAAQADAGIAADDAFVLENASRQALAAGVVRLVAMPDGPTALLAASGRATMAILDALRAVGRSDIAVVSFGDLPLGDVLTPGITCVDQDPRLIASAAFTRLGELISAPGSTPRRIDPKKIVVPTPLVARGSGELASAPRDQDTGGA